MTNAAHYVSRALAAEDARKYHEAQYNYTMAAIVETSQRSKKNWQRCADECHAKMREAAKR